jgi:uroporphyrinogen-III synthase
MRLLVTRPESDGEQTAAVLRARGHEVLLAPLLRIEPVTADFGTGPFAGVLLTSANAARALMSHPRRNEVLGLPGLTVGGKTLTAARDAGFAEALSADGDGRDLVWLAAARFGTGGGPLLYLAGEAQSVDLAADLARHGISVHTVVVYRAVQENDFPAAARMALEAGGLDGVLHYSRRSAEAFVHCSKALRAAALALDHYCLSEAVTGPLLDAGATRVRVAAHPDEAALLAVIPLP